MKSLLMAALMMAGTYAQAKEVSFRIQSSFEICTQDVCQGSSESDRTISIPLNNFGDGEYWFQREFLGDLRLDRSITIDDWGWRGCQIILNHTYLNGQDSESFGQMITCDELRKVKADRMISEMTLSDGTRVRTIQTIYMNE